MFDFVYVEEEISDHPRTSRILDGLPRATVVPCQRYGEIFNRGGQDFRRQKNNPALILAAKHGNRALETPAGYGIGHKRNYYFSHALNCVYDCRYCFLQGMYRSAHLVLFVNYEDFQTDISALATSGDPACFFSGYDGDSLAMEKISGFAGEFVDFFAELPHASLELRTKSARLRPLLERDALPNIITAFSLTPTAVGQQLEKGVPPLHRRLQAAARLQNRGWPLGLRFDPLVYCADFEARYRALFEQVFSVLDGATLHSVSLGTFRLPSTVFKTMRRLHPDEGLFAYGLEQRDGQTSYHGELATNMHAFCGEELMKYIDPAVFFPCSSTTQVSA
jgi:spore photoproduct lyase